MKIKNFYFGINILVIVSIAILSGSCQWTTIDLPPAVSNNIPVDKVVSFSAEIQPIFTDNCLGCHGASAQKGLDLSVGKAYSSITKSGYSSYLLDTANAANSKIYYFPKSSPSTQHSNYRTYKTGEDGLVLKWIHDGAKNN